MSEDAQTLRAAVSPEDAGQRLDRFLANTWSAFSRARVSALIQAGDVIDEAEPDRRLSPSDKVREGQAFAATPPPPAPATPAGEAIPLDILFEDDDLIVVDKPAGMTVHPAPGQMTGTLVNALIAHCGASLSGIGGVARPGIVHRIDKETSGLLVVAKHDQAHRALASQFEAHDVERAYLALIWGTPAPASGRIETLIGRDPRDRKRMSAEVTNGKRAVTHYRTTAAFGVGAAEIECRLETGRTHQIRVHMAHSGWPLIGDPVYGRASKARRQRLGDAARAAALAFPRQALHAASLGFRHPRSNDGLRFERPPPADMQELRAALETDAVAPHS